MIAARPYFPGRRLEDMRTTSDGRKQEITQLLSGARAGSPEAADRLLSAVYEDLRHLARSVMSSEGSEHTLQPTAVVNEAFLRLFQPGGSASSGWQSVQIDWQSRAHFLAVAARQMRLVLIDHARQRKAAKRGRGLKIALEDAGALAAAPIQDFDEIDQLLNLLATKDPSAARVVELKFFGGLTDREAALVMGISASKLRRDWEFARSWLRQRMQGAERI
jgi:RNA polymerase sigma factor (TIGR02999 family)